LFGFSNFWSQPSGFTTSIAESSFSGGFGLCGIPENLIEALQHKVPTLGKND